MQLKLTWKLGEKFDIDLMVSSDQQIAETLQILAENGILDVKFAKSVKFIKSLRTNDQINILLTYSEAKIYSGDVLVLQV